MKNKKLPISNFGENLTLIRKAKGLTQAELGKKVGVSKRVIAYYEKETNYPPAHLLIPIAKALNVSLDELLGAKRNITTDPANSKLWRRIKKVEHLSQKDQKAVIHYIEALATKNKILKQQ